MAQKFTRYLAETPSRGHTKAVIVFFLIIVVFMTHPSTFVPAGSAGGCGLFLDLFHLS